MGNYFLFYLDQLFKIRNYFKIIYLNKVQNKITLHVLYLHCKIKIVKYLK